MISIQDKIKIIEEIEARELAENSLYEFVKQAWKQIEDHTPFTEGWHIKAICEHLEAVIRKDIRNLLINVPPRTGKSSIISACFVAWVWIKMPYHRFIYASHSYTVCTRDSTNCRTIIESPWYQNRWGDRFKLLEDQNTKLKFSNNRTGFRLATTTNSKIAGDGASILLMDDPNDTNASDIDRENTNIWKDRTWSSRINNRKTDCKIIVQQRTHEKDVSGDIIAHDKQNRWTKLILPMEFEERRKCKTIVLPSTNGKVWEDPRKAEGELLWPEGLGPNELREFKDDLKNAYNIAGQLQQRPAPEGGHVLQRSWFQLWKQPKPPKLLHIITSWDTALSLKKKSCFSAFTTWGVFEDRSMDQRGHLTGRNNIILLACGQYKVEYPTLRQIMQRIYFDYRDDDIDKPIIPNGDHVSDLVLVENKSSGGALVPDMMAAGIPAQAFDPDQHGDKLARVRLISHLVENKRVFVPAKPPHYDEPRNFADKFIQQCIMFPNGEFNDLVDTFSQVLIRLKDEWLSNSRNIEMPEERRSEYNEKRPLYG